MLKKQNMLRNYIFISLILIILFLSCQKKETIAKSSNITEIDSDILVKNIIVIKNQDSLSGVYSDIKTTSIKDFIIGNSTPLTSYIDKIDIDGRKPCSTVNYFSYFSYNEKEYLFYNDYGKKSKQILKLLTRDKDNNLWTVYPQPIKNDAFQTLATDDNIIIIYFNDKLRVGYLENLYVKEIENCNISIDSLKNFKAVYYAHNNTIGLIYLNNDNTMFSRNISLKKDIDNFTIETNQDIQIDTNIKYYDIEKDIDNNLYLVYYKENDYSLNMNKLYSNSKKVILGYLPDMHSLDLLIKNNLFLISYSSPNTDKKRQKNEKFYLSIIYNGEISDKNSWREEKILYSTIPFFAIDSIADGKHATLIAGSDSLKIIKISTDSLLK